MSAGEGLVGTFPIALRHYQMDKVIVITDVKERSSKDVKAQKVAQAIRDIVQMANAVKLEITVIEVDGLSISEIMAKFIDVYAKSYDDHYFFNVTGGKKPLALGLFMASVWVGGTCYYVNEGGNENAVQELKVPRMHLNDVRSNPNYESFLVMLDERGEMDLKMAFSLMQERYVPMRSPAGVTKRTFSRPTMTKWLRQLNDWGLIEIKQGRNQREKVVTLSDEGMFTARFLRAGKIG
jgi:hypothetical protein